MDKATADAKLVEVQAAAEERGALWKRFYTGPLGITSKYGIFAVTQTDVVYRWNEVDGKFYLWG